MTTIITGRDLSLTIDGKTYDTQATSVTLTNSPTMDAYQTLAGKKHNHTDDQWTLNVEMLADWGAVDSICLALWNAANSAPNTTLSGFLISNDNFGLDFNVFPVFPALGGAAPGAQTISLSFVVDGKPTID